MNTAKTVGIPKEIKTGERRVGITPRGVKYLTRSGFRVLVEKGAGVKSNFSDAEYEKSGALVVSSAHRVWKACQFIQKVKEPQPAEYPFFQSKHTLFCFLHLASQENRRLVSELIKSQMTAIGYETVEKNGEAVILQPMSEMAGTLAGYFSGLLTHLVEIRDGEISMNSWYQKILERAIQHYPEPLSGSEPGNVLILGGGHVGEKAGEMAHRMGGRVTITELNRDRREALLMHFMNRKMAVNILSPAENWEEALRQADVLIGAVHVRGKKAPVIVTENMLKEASAKKKVIIDVAVDQGGNVFGSRSTDFEKPVYLDAFGNVRFAVANLPSLLGPAASEALEKVSLDYTRALAEDMDLAIRQYPELESGINVRAGKLVNQDVASAHPLAP